MILADGFDQNRRINSLIEALGVSTGVGSLPASDPINAINHLIMQGVGDLNFMEIGGLKVNNGDGIVVASLDNDAFVVAGTYGQGRFVIVEDVHLLDNRWYSAENRRFAENLFHWVTYLEK